MQLSTASKASKNAKRQRCRKRQGYDTRLLSQGACTHTTTRLGTRGPGPATASRAASRAWGPLASSMLQDRLLCAVRAAWRRTLATRELWSARAPASASSIMYLSDIDEHKHTSPHIAATKIKQREGGVRGPQGAGKRRGWCMGYDAWCKWLPRFLEVGDFNALLGDWVTHKNDPRT